MKDQELEDIFKHAFQGDHSSSLPNDLWGGIEAELQKKKKKRAIIWWFFGGSLAVLAFLMSYSFLSNKKENIYQPRVELTTNKNKSSNVLIDLIPDTNNIIQSNDLTLSSTSSTINHTQSHLNATKTPQNKGGQLKSKGKGKMNKPTKYRIDSKAGELDVFQGLNSILNEKEANKEFQEDKEDSFSQNNIDELIVYNSLNLDTIQNNLKTLPSQDSIKNQKSRRTWFFNAGVYPALVSQNTLYTKKSSDFGFGAIVGAEITMTNKMNLYTKLSPFIIHRKAYISLLKNNGSSSPDTNSVTLVPDSNIFLSPNSTNDYLAASKSNDSTLFRYKEVGIPLSLGVSIKLFGINNLYGSVELGANTMLFSQMTLSSNYFSQTKQTAFFGEFGGHAGFTLNKYFTEQWIGYISPLYTYNYNFKHSYLETSRQFFQLNMGVKYQF